MAKTHRKKINTSPRTVFGRNSRPVVVNKGALIKTSGVRSVVEETKGSKDGKNIFVSRIYTGIPKGKLYPYRSEKRGGAPGAQATK